MCGETRMLFPLMSLTAATCEHLRDSRNQEIGICFSLPAFERMMENLSERNISGVTDVNNGETIFGDFESSQKKRWTENNWQLMVRL